MQNSILRRPFDPAAHDLDSNFRLTKYSDLKGCACKVPQTVLTRLLSNIFTQPVNEEEQNGANFMFMEQPTVQRIGMAGLSDCSVVKLKQPNLCLLQTADYLYPLIDDPYMMGMVACANILSDLYATGVTTCDTIQMLLGISSRITQKERDVIAPLIIRGFKDAADSAGVSVKGGQTVVNPWMLIGGIATSVVPRDDFILPNKANFGDVLVLTKPLGTHIACLTTQWMNTDREKWARIKVVLSEDEAEKSFQRALSSMSRLNRAAAEWMKQYNAHGATDVSGYGLIGAAQALAKVQEHDVDFVIHNLPVIAKMAAVNKVVGNVFNLTQGLSPETSGGLLIVFPREDGAAFAKKMEMLEGLQAWIVGVVQRGNKTARVIEKPRIIEVPMKDKPDEIW